MVVTMFGTGATYNNDGTISGVPNGAVYTYNPDSPDGFTTATPLNNFVSPFAGYTQGCIHCTRTDTALRVYFRKDVSPDPTRIEIILELGHFTTDGSAANLGPFALQILKAGVAQGIPVNTASGAGSTWVPGGATFTGTTNVMTAYFPSMGWFSRWRWNPTPRPVIRTNTQLLPANLNLVPNFSASLATTYNCIDCGQPGSQSTPITAYSSAFNATGQGSNGSTWSNYNPTGVNEGTGQPNDMENTGAQPGLGVVNEWEANWLCNANSTALAALLVLGEVNGGIPWACRDLSTGAPPDLFAHPNLNTSSGAIDKPAVYVPSTVARFGQNSTSIWDLEVSHLPSLGYVAYLITGDSYFLENLQLQAGWVSLFTLGARWDGYVLVNHADPNSAALPTNGQPEFDTWRFQTRSLAWQIRVMACAYLATPASTPSWLSPQSYWKSVLDLNASLSQSFGTNYESTYPSNAVSGDILGTNAFEESFMIGFAAWAMGFAVNQGGLANWLPYYQLAAKMIVMWGTGDGTTTWAPQLGVPYVVEPSPQSTDYLAAPSEWATAADFWAWHRDSGVLPATGGGLEAWGSQMQLEEFGPTGLPWASGQVFTCNSHVVEVRAGCPVTLNTGDVVSLTVNGAFAGSPVTVSYTLSAGDAAAILRIAVTSMGPGGGPPNPVIANLISQINANATLSAAGIAAALTPAAVPNYGTRGSGAMQYVPSNGRMYLTYRGATVGPVTVTGSLTTTTGCDLYIQPNGDPCSVGNSGPGGRPLNYQAASNFTSAAGGTPSGTALQTVITTSDGGKWCFVPESKNPPWSRPGLGAGLPAFPEIGFGGAYDSYSYYAYLPSVWVATAYMQTAGITNAAAARTQYTAALNRYFSDNPGSSMPFGDAVAP